MPVLPFAHLALYVFCNSPLFQVHLGILFEEALLPHPVSILNRSFSISSAMYCALCGILVCSVRCAVYVMCLLLAVLQMSMSAMMAPTNAVKSAPTRMALTSALAMQDLDSAVMHALAMVRRCMCCE